MVEHPLLQIPHHCLIAPDSVACSAECPTANAQKIRRKQVVARCSACTGSAAWPTSASYVKRCEGITDLTRAYTLAVPLSP